MRLLLGVVLFFTVTPLYPLSKRLTNWPQAVLGTVIELFHRTSSLMFHRGKLCLVRLVRLVRGRSNIRLASYRAALLGDVLVSTSNLRLADRADYFAFSWTVHYDTIYASPDKKYDEKIGVHSTARLFGDYIRPILFVFCAGFVASLAYAGYVNQQGPIYYVVDVAFTASVLLWQLVMTGDFEKDGSRLYRVCFSTTQLIYVMLTENYVTGQWAHRLCDRHWLVGRLCLRGFVVHFWALLYNR